MQKVQRFYSADRKVFVTGQTVLDASRYIAGQLEGLSTFEDAGTQFVSVVGRMPKQDSSRALTAMAEQQRRLDKKQGQPVTESVGQMASAFAAGRLKQVLGGEKLDSTRAGECLAKLLVHTPGGIEILGFMAVAQSRSERSKGPDLPGTKRVV